ncbi:hypothetical protein AB4Y45_32520 [Paraburkholderia sp. EG287A]|uniref:hypothetical protein n=1 Tax=Paraburkholderia sp. EG287A TaxID=3237012 RepID=UPI0034D1B316
MNENIVIAKHAQVLTGEAVVMSNAELDWLIDRDMHPGDVVSIPNPNQVGLLDAYLVGKTTCPQLRAERAKVELLTTATRSTGAVRTWDEPQGASSPRGWYWPKGTTRPGETLCAGHYLDYGVGHKRYDPRQEVEAGNIHCVVIAKDTGKAVSWRYVETLEAARSWIESEAARFGHPKH